MNAGLTQNNMAKKLIAVTGGIGSGKSTVINLIREFGYNVLSCDKIVNDIYVTRKGVRLIKRLFPSAVTGFIKPKIDKKVLTALAFSSPQHHKKLTDAVTPLVLQEVQRQGKKLDGIVFVEVPLLFECNYQSEFDDTIVVIRDKQQRIASVMARSNLSREQVQERMAKQVDYDTLDLSPFTIIKNDGNVDELKQTVSALLKTF